MGGGPFPSSMGVHKNKFVEEWNGKREITEKTWEVGQANLPALFLMCFVIPYGVYAWTRAEFESKGDSRYKEMF